MVFVPRGTIHVRHDAISACDGGQPAARTRAPPAYSALPTTHIPRRLPATALVAQRNMGTFLTPWARRRVTPGLADGAWPVHVAVCACGPTGDAAARSSVGGPLWMQPLVPRPLVPT